jgi:hypothetical protein
MGIAGLENRCLLARFTFRWFDIYLAVVHAGMGVFTGLLVVQPGFDFALAGESLSFACTKESNQRKYTPEPQPAKKTAGSLVGHNRRGR